jgi:hypothetical protein
MNDFITIKDFPDEQLLTIYQTETPFEITVEMAKEEYELRHEKEIARNPYLKYNNKIIRKIYDNRISAYKFEQYNKNTDDIKCENIEIKEVSGTTESFIKSKVFRRREWNIDSLFYDYEDIDDNEWNNYLSKLNIISQTVKDTILND